MTQKPAHFTFESAIGTILVWMSESFWLRFIEGAGDGRMTLWVLIVAAVVDVWALDVWTICCPAGMAILMMLELDLTETGIDVPGLMFEGKIGVLTVTSWVFELREG